MRRFCAAAALAAAGVVAGPSASAEPVRGFLEVAVNERVSFSPKFQFTNKGTTVDEAGEELAVRLGMLQVPLLFRTNVARAGAVRPFVLAGLALGFIASATDESGVEGTHVRDRVKAMEFSGVVGAGLQFHRGVVEGRYDHGFTNLTEEGDEAKSRTFSVLVGIVL